MFTDEDSEMQKALEKLVSGYCIESVLAHILIPRSKTYSYSILTDSPAFWSVRCEGSNDDSNLMDLLIMNFKRSQRVESSFMLREANQVLIYVPMSLSERKLIAQKVKLFLSVKSKHYWSSSLQNCYRSVAYVVHSYFWCRLKRRM